jgi:hypothetical protein
MDLCCRCCLQLLVLRLLLLLTHSCDLSCLVLCQCRVPLSQGLPRWDSHTTPAIVALWWCSLIVLLCHSLHGSLLFVVIELVSSCHSIVVLVFVSPVVSGCLSLVQDPGTLTGLQHLVVGAVSHCGSDLVVLFCSLRSNSLVFQTTPALHVHRCRSLISIVEMCHRSSLSKLLLPLSLW